MHGGSGVQPPQPEPSSGRRTRPVLLFAVILAAALVVAAFLNLARPGSAGEVATATPTLTPTPVATATPVPTPFPSTLVRQIVQTYWSDIANGEIKLAYGLLTDETRVTLTEAEFQRNIATFLQTMGSVSADAGTVTVSGPHATVELTLHATNPANDVRTYQRLLWEDATWKISPPSGRA